MLRTSLQFPRFFCTTATSSSSSSSAATSSMFASRRAFGSSSNRRNQLLRFPVVSSSSSSSSAAAGGGGLTFVASEGARQSFSLRSINLNPFAKQGPKVDSELDPRVYDKTTVHYTGKIFGVSTDTLFFYSKVGLVLLCVYLLIYLFTKGYSYLMSFSLAAVGRLGFFAGFWSAMVLFSTFLQLKKRYSISPNAVYNQTIATVMKNPEVIEFLGTYPKTGNFRAYHHSGGFKLPLMRRIRSGTYELADALGTKPQQLQMIMTLKGENQKEAMVTADVRKIHSRMFSSTYHFHSLAVHMKNPVSKEEKMLVLIGRDEDVVYKGLFQ